MPVLRSLADAARAIMRLSGNLNQWTNGYPSDEVFLADIQHGCSYLMTDADGTPVATFAFIPGPDPTYARIYDDVLPDGQPLRGAWTDDTLPYHVVHRIASLPHRHGVFAAMLQFCFGRAQSIRIDTHRDNCIMHHLLQKHGFSRCGIIHLLNGDERIAYQRVAQPPIIPGWG